MTFRPSDDVLDEIESGQNTSFSVSQNTVGGSENGGEYFFSSSENSNSGTNGELENNGSPIVYDLPVEEVKAPDLLDLLKDDGDDLGSIEEQPKIEMENMVSNDLSDLNENLGSGLVVNLDSQIGEQNIENPMQGIEMDEDVVSGEISDDNQEEVQEEGGIDGDSGKITDAHRQEIALSVKGSVSSNLDFLVDDNWLWFVNIYKTISRLLFRWGAVFFAIVCGVAGGTFLQIKDVYSDGVKMFNDGMIRNKSLWIEETSDKKLSELNDEGIDVNVIIPYGSAVLDNHSFESKSNLISYKGIVLPQLAFIRYDSDESIFGESFDEGNTTREDIEKLIKYLILDDAVYKKTGALPNASDIRWSANMFQGGLINGFNLGCLYSDKVSDIVCDRFLDIFNKYGKYFDLSVYASEISSLVKEMEKHSKDIEPVCSMIKDYTLRSGESSDILMSLMEDCGAYDYMFYRKLVNFIDLEKSLEQPQLADKVFDDSDLNAYKLLSAWQNVYKILEGTSINEGYIKSYLSYAQSLLNKDKGTGRYLQPIYRDMLYVFNMDQLYQKLIQKGKLSSEIKTQIDQINNGNTLYGYVSLLSTLTVPNIVKSDIDLESVATEQRTLEDIFSQYYSMTDRLKIRKAEPISDYELKVQTELFSDKILMVTDGETLKVSGVLYRQDNVLYVSSIKIANQPKFSEILGIYALEGNITFYAMLNYIEEQVDMRYEQEPEEIEEQPGLCSELQEWYNLSVYNCDDSSISLYKGDVEYDFVLVDGRLDSFTISDEKLDSLVRDKLNGLMFVKEDTPVMIRSIINFSLESESDDNLEKKLDVINQFRIHFKLVPDKVEDIEGKINEFLVSFVLGDFNLQGIYNVDSHLLTKVSYVACNKTLEIKGLTLEITSENDSQLIEILNNPKVFLVQINQAAYKKYQKMCNL